MSAGKIGGVLTGVAIAGILVGGIICTERIPVGYEGVVYSMNGGVQEETLTQGWHVVAPTKKVKEFTVSNEQLLLTKDDRNGSEGDESFKVSTADDASIAISFQMSYRFLPETLIKTYSKFRGMDGQDIVENRVKAVLKSKISEITTDYSMMDIYSGNRSEINNKITEVLNNSFKTAYGIEVMDASIVDVHPDDQLKKAIDARVKALQKKEQAEAEQQTKKVEAETKIIEAEAEAKANQIIANSITQPLIDKEIADARLQHGWVTVKGANVVATDGE